MGSTLMQDGMAILPIFEEMQATGMTASRVAFEELNAHCETVMHRCRTQLSNRYYNSKPFNPASPPQVRSLMRRRSLQGEKRTPTGEISTAKKSVEHLRYEDDAMALVMEWREHQKVRDTFCRPVLARIPMDQDIYPVRCQIKPTRVTTRRLAAANPNLLQMPIRSEIGRRVRECYVAPKGQLYGGWDFSQIEMRVMAHESRDKLLCKMFNEGRDIHTETAAKVFHLDIDDVDKMKHRLPSKNAGFGLLYGIGGKGLYELLRSLGASKGWTIRKCERLINDWLTVHSGVKQYILDEIQRLAGTVNGEVRDHWGMPRYLPGIHSPDRMVQSEAGRMAVSHKIQGGAQGMIQKSMIWLAPMIKAMQDAGEKVHWCLQVHDEIILRFDEGLKDELHELVMEALTVHGGWGLRVPVEADGKTAKTWGGLK